MAFKSNIEQVAERIDEIKVRFQPLAREVIRELAPHVERELKRSWPVDSGKSKAGLIVKKMAAGISVRNSEPYWSYAGWVYHQRIRSRSRFGEGTIRNKAVPGFIYRVMPAIVGAYDERIRDHMTEQLIHALTPEEG